MDHANKVNTPVIDEKLVLSVSVIDDEGTEIAQFNERAYLIQEGGKGKAKGKAHSH